MVLSTEELNDLKKIELEIFKSFISVCEKLNVKYYLVEGTLLGAVRHKGFIPWDDDIDVGMLREDYEIFIKRASEYLPENLFLQTHITDKEYSHGFAKIRNSQTTFIESNVKDCKINHGIYIDIFPLDNCETNIRNSKLFRFKRWVYCIRSSKLMKNCKLSLKSHIIRMGCAFICPSAHDAVKKLSNLHKSMPQGKQICNFYSIYGKKEIMPKEWYGDGTIVEFEGLKVNAPLEYDKWLSQIYGDYMKFPPKEKRVTHHLTEVIDVKKPYKYYTNIKKTNSFSN